jgi:putative ABC transport system substrate-binding protein
LIIDLAARLRLPTIYSFRFYAGSGGLVSYGIDQTELVREAASYVDRILRGQIRLSFRCNCRPNINW